VLASRNRKLTFARSIHTHTHTHTHSHTHGVFVAAGDARGGMDTG
jgi:hypothetical protein